MSHRESIVWQRVESHAFVAYFRCCLEKTQSITIISLLRYHFEELAVFIMLIFYIFSHICY